MVVKGQQAGYHDRGLSNQVDQVDGMSRDNAKSVDFAYGTCIS